MQRIAAGTILIAAVVVLAFLALPHVLSEQSIRAEVSRSIEAATGVVPRIQGPARIALLPRPAIRIAEVSLGEGAGSELAAGSLQASLQFWPLLFGEIRIATLTLERPRVAVDLSPDGKLIGSLPINWSMPAEEDVPELRVVNGTLLLRVPGRERVDIIHSVQASLNWSGVSLTASGSFMLGDKLANGVLVISNTTAFAKGERSPARLRLESEPLRMAFEGGITLRNNVVQSEGVLSADGPSLRQALRLVGYAAPGAAGFGRFSLKSAMILTPISLAFSNLAFELDGNRAEGGFTWKRDGDRFILQATLASEAMDLSAYRGLLPLLSVNGRDWNTAPIDTSYLQNLELDLRISCGKLTMGKIALGKAAISFGIKERRLIATVGEAQFYGGTLRGTAAWAAADGTSEFKIDANLVNFDLERGLGGLSGFRRLEGIGTLAVSASANGKSAQEIATALSGTVQLGMKQGALSGINAEAVLRRLERRPLSGTGDLRGGRTPFERLVGKLEISQGVATLTQLDIESPILKIKLAGEASVARREFDLRGVASLMRAPQAGATQVSFNLPFLIQGNWDSPYLLPDPEALIRHSGAAAPLLDAVRGKAAREAMRNVIETVTGLRSIGELPANPTFDPPVVTPLITPEPAPEASPQ